MSYSSCCVPGCIVRIGQGVPLHVFPNPNQDVERLRIWINNIGGEILAFTNSFIFKHRRVCHRHFDAIYHYPKNRLSKLAVPTLHISGVGLQLYRTQHIPFEEIPSTSTAYVGFPVYRTQHIPIKEIQITSTTCVQSDAQVPSANVQIRSPLAQKSTGSNRNNLNTKKEIELQKEIKILKMKMARLNKRKNLFKQRLSIALKMRKSVAFEVLCGKLSKPLQTFINLQIQQAGKKGKGRLYTMDEKILALSFYKSSPKAYRLISNICVLPKKKTLLNVLQFNR